MSHPPGHGVDDGTGTVEGPMMMMYFHGGYKEYVLFKFFETKNIGGFVGAVVGIFLLALIYEALKFYREFLYEKNSTYGDSAVQHGLLGGIKRNILRSHHLIQTILHMIQLVLSYFLMLVFMTYNIYLAVAITLGAGVGYLLFGWNKRSALDVTEHCH